MKKLVSSGVKFLIVGGLSTLIEFGVFNLLVYGVGLDAVTAKVLASLVALVNAYFGNREWAFRHREHGGRGRQLALFLIVNAACTALGAALVAVGVALLHSANPLRLNAVNLVSVIVVVLARFGFYHWLVFPRRPRLARLEVAGSDGS